MAGVFAIPVAVALFGKLLGESKVARENPEVRENNDIPLELIPSSSDRSLEVNLAEHRLASQKWQESQHPTQTNVIPGNFNQFYHENGDPIEPQYHNAPPRSGSTLPQFHHLSQEEIAYRENTVYEGPMFGGTGTMFKREIDLGIGTNKTSRGVLPPRKADSAIVYTDPNTHNNMVPFFGSQATQNMEPDAHKTTLETFTGTGELIDRHKTESETFFAPEPENIFGTPNVPEEYRKNRYIQSNLKTSLLPVPQVRVAPMSEFEENFRPYIKNIDGLRAKTNPKITYAGRPQGPMHGTEQRGMEGQVSKNQPERTFFIGDNDYVIPAPASYQARKMDEDYTTALQCTERGQENATNGHAGPAVYKATQTRLKKRKIKSHRPKMGKPRSEGGFTQ